MPGGTSKTYSLFLISEKYPITLYLILWFGIMAFIDQRSGSSPQF